MKPTLALVSSDSTTDSYTRISCNQKNSIHKTFTLTTQTATRMLFSPAVLFRSCTAAHVPISPPHQCIPHGTDATCTTTSTRNRITYTLNQCWRVHFHVIDVSKTTIISIVFFNDSILSIYLNLDGLKLEIKMFWKTRKLKRTKILFSNYFENSMGSLFGISTNRYKARR